MTGQTYRLKDICSIKSGKRIPLGMDFTTEITNYPYIRARDIKGGKIQTDDLIYIDEIVFNKIKKYIIKSGDIAITIVGASVGDVAYAQDEIDGFNLTENAVRLTEFNSIVDGKYLFYVLNQEQYHEYMQTVAGGAAQPKLGIYKVERIKVFLPPLNIQKEIASILTAYDNLIENNNKRIRLLEQMAENLYKEWFVRFRFPGHEKAEFENGLPKGWSLKNLFDVADVSYGYAFKSDLFCNDKNLNAVVRIRDIQDNHTDTYTSEVCDDKYLIEENAILVGMDGLFHMCLWNGEKAYLNQRVVKICSKKKDMCNYMIFMAIRPQIKFWEQVIAGTTVAHLGDKHLKKIKIAVPTEDLLLKANESIQRIMVEKNQLFKQNQILSRQRDLLLPRLMSGKLEVKL